MGNTQSGDIDKNKIEQLKILQQIKNQSEIIAQNQNKILNHNINRNSTNNSYTNSNINPEIRRTLLENKHMQRQVINKLTKDMQQQNLFKKKNSYNKVNNYLNNLDVLETDQQDNNLYINQGYTSQNTINFNKEDAEQDFKLKEKKLEQEFKNDEKKRRLIFLEQQKRRREVYKKELKKFENSNIDPYELFNLTKNFTLDELKSSYKKLALVTHPDKPNGSPEKFQLVTKTYLSLLEKYNISQADKQYLDLRNSSRDYISNQSKTFNPESKDFDIDLFNKIYNENKLEDANDHGYEEWCLDNQYDSDEIKQSSLFSNKFNLDVFNNTFQNQKSTKDVVIYREPESLVSSKMNFSEIAEENITDYGGKSKNLDFTDYKQAYTTCSKINPGRINRKNYNNLTELKNDRSKVSYILSESEAKNQHLNKLKQEQQELYRRELIKKKDEQIFKQYQKVNRLMLQ